MFIVLIFFFAIYFFLKQGNDISKIFIIIGVFAFASVRLLPSIVKIIKAFQSIKYNLPVVNLIYNELNLPDHFLTKSIVCKKNNFDFKNIKFKDINFSFFNQKKEKKILENLNFDLNKGDKIGIIGPTGTGKTTFVNLLLGLLTPTKGKIFINSELVDNNLSFLQSKVGYVPQQVYLADESLLFNISLEEQNMADIKLVNTIVKTLDLEGFINSFPNKLYTKVGERGSRISGGQLQRIGIARALYRKPSILVLDKSTNSLDKKVEQNIIENVFNNEIVNTIICISHRESSFKYCNKIFKLEDKKLKEI